jgi:predicted RNase H-like nuclease
MKNIFLLVSLFCFSIFCKAQISQVDNVTTKIQLQALNGSARLVYLSDSNSLYSLCSVCTVNNIDIIGGQNGKKWRKVQTSGGGGGGGIVTQTLDQTFSIGDTLSTNRSINLNGHVLTFNLNVLGAQIIQYKTSNSNPGNFGMALDGNYLNPDGQRDWVMMDGYNANGGGGRINTAEAAFWQSRESHYQEFGINPPQFEWIWQSQTYTGKNTRHMHMNIFKATGYTHTMYRMDDVIWFATPDSVDVPYFSIGTSGSTSITGSTAQVILTNSSPSGGGLGLITSGDGGGSSSIVNYGTASDSRLKFSSNGFNFRSTSPLQGEDFAIVGTNSSGNILNVRKEPSASGADNYFSVRNDGKVFITDIAAPSGLTYGVTVNDAGQLISVPGGGSEADPVYLAQKSTLAKLDVANFFQGNQDANGVFTSHLATVNPTFRFEDGNWEWFRDDQNVTGNQYSLVTKGGGAGSRRFMWVNSDFSIRFSSYIGDLSSSNTVENAFLISPTASQSGTAGYNALLVKMSEGSVGSGTKNLINLALGSTSLFSVSNNGSVRSYGIYSYDADFSGSYTDRSLIDKGYLDTRLSGLGGGGGYTDENAQDAIGAMISSEFTYVDATPSLSINSIAATKITPDATHGFVTDVEKTTWNGKLNVTDTSTMLLPYVRSNATSSVDNELTVFDKTGGRTLKRATGTGHLSLTSGVYSVSATIPKADVGLGNVENTALSTWAGSTNITTLGTVSTGTWSATSIVATKGGTGISTYTLGDIIYSDASNSLAKLTGNTAASNRFLRQIGNGTISAAPTWSTVTSTDVGLGNVENTALSTWSGSTNVTILGTIATGTWNATAIGIGKGGTGQTTASAAFNALSPSTTLGDLIVGDGANSNARLAGNTTTTRKFLRQVGNATISALPTWDVLVAGDVPNLAESQVTNLTTDLNAKVNVSDTSGMLTNYVRSNNSGTSVDNELVVYDKTGGRTVKRATGTGYVSLTSGVYSVSTTIPASVVGLGSVENTALSTWPGTANIVTVGTITTGTWSATAVGPTKGGTGFTTYTLGDIVYSDASNSLAKLTGNTTTTRKFLRQVGNATVSAAPAWDVLAAGDIPNITESQVTNLTTDLAAKINVSDSSGMLTNYVRSNNGSTSVDGEVVIYDKTGGRTVKRASGTGPAKLASGVLSASNINLASEVTGDLPFANIVQVATATILGRTTAATGDIEVLTVLPTAVFPALTGEVTNSVLAVYQQRLVMRL